MKTEEDDGHVAMELASVVVKAGRENGRSRHEREEGTCFVGNIERGRWGYDRDRDGSSRQRRWGQRSLDQGWGSVEDEEETNGGKEAVWFGSMFSVSFSLSKIFLFLHLFFWNFNLKRAKNEKNNGLCGGEKMAEDFWLTKFENFILRKSTKILGTFVGWGDQKKIYFFEFWNFGGGSALARL